MSGHSSVFGVLWLRLCRAVCHRSGLLLRLNSGLRGSRLPGQRLPRAFDCSRATLTSSRAKLIGVVWVLLGHVSVVVRVDL